MSTTLICGHFEFDRDIDHPFLQTLPEIIYLAESNFRESSWLETATKVMVQETGSGKPGADVVAERVGYTSEAAFNRAFKRRFNQNPGAMRRVLLTNER